ncbi:cysteine--tRNA ligase [Candidatus Micrarchaeota archaeon]|nr:cysteine--tRNA ligase [Candidatus Micrarchaeota archaeon]
MALKITSTLSGKIEEFKPIVSGKVGMYVCGITPYSDSHIGHARCYIVWDTVRRFLLYEGYDVKYIQNFTDVDDKIINKANELKIDPLKLSEKHIKEYFEEFDKLNVMRADAYPKVTEHILEIVAMIEKLVEKKIAYESKGDVFFDVSKFKEYGKLSKQALDELIRGKRVEINPNKKNAADFALWKSAKKGEPFWESPWGNGRPGWHIECSAMSEKYLGEKFDLHCGGQDLIFPHHENEIAQSEGASGKKPFAKYWMHNGFVTIKKEKMAKSVGNILNVKEMQKKYEGEEIRFFMLQTQYRQPLDYSELALKNSTESFESLKNAAWRLEQKIGAQKLEEIYDRKEKGDGRENEGKIEKKKLNNFNKAKISDADLIQFREKFISAMENDINTPEAISVLFGIRDYAFKELEANADGKRLVEIHLVLKELANVLGLLNKSAKKNEKGAISEAEIKELIDERQHAKAKKDFKHADAIRNELKGKGILLEDNKDGSVGWKAA